MITAITDHANTDNQRSCVQEVPPEERSKGCVLGLRPMVCPVTACLK